MEEYEPIENTNTEVFDVMYWGAEDVYYILAKIFIVIALFTCLRIFSGAISNTNATRQLAEKDNPAFGISMAGVVLAVAIMIMGTLYGQPEHSVTEVIVSTGLYGLLGIGLMSISRFIFDHVSLPKISLGKLIKEGNVAAGIVDAGNVISSAVIIYAVMTWVEYNSVTGIQAVLVGYIISQIILNATGLLRIKLFNRSNTKTSLHKEISQGNSALAIRFSGYRIGTAFAIAAATNTLLYDLNQLGVLIAGWVGVSIVTLIILAVMGVIADRVILYNIDSDNEVVTQRNMAIGVVQGTVYLSLGMLLFTLL